jgi:hypothetical protein
MAKKEVYDIERRLTINKSSLDRKKQAQVLHSSVHGVRTNKLRFITMTKNHKFLSLKKKSFFVKIIADN